MRSLVLRDAAQVRRIVPARPASTDAQVLAQLQAADVARLGSLPGGKADITQLSGVPFNWVV